MQEEIADSCSHTSLLSNTSWFMQGACASFSTAVRLNPSSADDFNNLACVYKDLGAIQEAIHNYRQALLLRPDNPNVFCNLVHSLQMVCDWTEYDTRMLHLIRIVETQIQRAQFPSVHPHHSFLYRLTNPTRRAIAAAHASAAERNVAAMQRNYLHRRVRGDGRLRIGYVSSDFKVSGVFNYLASKRKDYETMCTYIYIHIYYCVFVISNGLLYYRTFFITDIYFGVHLFTLNHTLIHIFSLPRLLI